MLTKIIFASSYSILFLLSSYYYKNHNKNYTEGKTEKAEGALQQYTLIDIYLRASTLLVVMLSVYSSHKYLFIVHNNSALSYTGLFFAFVGMYFFIRSISELGENYSPCYDAYLPHTITRKGLYSLVRHPIYTANIFTLFALFVASGSLWILFNTVLCAYFYNKSAVREEAELSQKYTDYDEYAKSTNRYLPSPQRLFN